MNSYISIDLETTGFSTDTCDIIEIGAWKIKDGVVVDKYCSLVRPYMYIPRNIQQITGITMEDVEDCEPIEPNLISLFEFCEELPFLGHNLQFDYRFLLSKGKNIGLDFSLNGTRTGTDTMKLAKSLLKLDSNKLQDVASHFNIHLDDNKGGYHRAGYDAYVTKLIYDRFLVLYNQAHGVVLPELLSIDDKKYGKVVNNETLSFS